MKVLNRYGGFICIIVGLMVCIGWYIKNATMITILPGLAPMKFNTGLCFVIIGTAYQLHYWYKKWSLFLAILLHVVSLAIALITALQYFNINLIAIDEAFVQDTITTNASPGRMSLMTTVCIILTNLTGITFISKLKKKYSIILVSASTISFFSFISLLAYGYGIDTEQRVWFMASMALHTSVLFLLVSAVFLAAILRKGYLHVFVTNSIAGKASRRFAWFFSASLVLLGFIQLRVIRAGLLTSEFALVMLVSITIGITVCAVYLIGTYLMRMEDEQSHAIEVLSELNKDIGGVDVQSNAQNNTSTWQFAQLINQTKELSQELNYKNNLLNDYVNVVSHNLRSPVANLTGLLQLHEMSGNDEEKKNYIVMFKNVTTQLLDMLNGMMEMLSVEYKEEVPKNEIVLFEMVNNIKTILLSEINSSGIVITEDFTACNTVSYPTAYMESILLNLMSNAIKYRSTDKQANMNITTVSVNNGIELKISDNGKGIDLEKNGDKLFGLFNTFHQNKDAKGLGLYMVKKQVERMGGTIVAESKVGIGTTFTIFIPV